MDSQCRRTWELDKATRLVDFLNSNETSPWRGKIRTANDPRRNLFNEQSMVQAIVKYVLVANNPIAAMKDPVKEQKIFLNYWLALSEIIDDDDGNATVLYRYNGVQLFCRFSIPFFTKLQGFGNFTVNSMKETLVGCFQNVEGEYAGVGHAEFWTKGGKASGLNMAAIGNIAKELATALHKSSMPEEIVI